MQVINALQAGSQGKHLGCMVAGEHRLTRAIKGQLIHENTIQAPSHLGHGALPGRAKLQPSCFCMVQIKKNLNWYQDRLATHGSFSDITCELPQPHESMHTSPCPHICLQNVLLNSSKYFP